MTVRCCRRTPKGKCDRGNQPSFLEWRQRNGELRLAICTLITMGDAYLPGVMALAWSLRKACGTNMKTVTMMCMVTSDVPQAAIQCIRTAYDVVQPVPTLSVEPKNIMHRNTATRSRYSVLYSKMNVFGLYDFDRVLFLDADMLVLNKGILDLFVLPPPSAVFTGCVNIPKDYSHAYERKLCPQIRHGALVPTKLLVQKCDRYTQQFIKFETSVFLVKPTQASMTQVHEHVNQIRRAPNVGHHQSDTGLFNKLFARSTHVINGDFLGRWQRVTPEMMTLDSYGFHYKPWNDVPSLYYDVTYWRMTFLQLLGDKKINHPVMQRAAQVCINDELKADEECRSELGRGVQGFACLISSGLVRKFSKESPNNPPHWIMHIESLESAVSSAPYVASMCMLPILATIRGVFHRSTSTVFMMYDAPYAGANAVPILAALPDERERITHDIQLLLATLRGAGLYHNDLTVNNVLFVKGAPKGRPVIRVIDWDRMTDIKPVRFVTEQQRHEANNDAISLVLSWKRKKPRSSVI